MSDTVLTVALSDDKISRLRRKYPRLRDEEALARVVDEGLEPSSQEEAEEDPEAILARLRRDFPDDPMVNLIGAISVPVDESPAEHHDKYAYGD